MEAVRNQSSSWLIENEKRGVEERGEQKGKEIRGEEKGHINRRVERDLIRK